MEKNAAFAEKARQTSIVSNRDFSELDPEAVAEKVVNTTGVSKEDHHDYIQMLRETVAEHDLDPNFPADILFRARRLLEDDQENIDMEQLQRLVAEIEREKRLLLDDSPYPEVRAVVQPTDDTSIPVNTFRVWLLGTFFTIIGTGLDQFFSLRQPGILVATSCAQVVAYPFGVFMAKYLPTRRYGKGWWSFTLNPGPFNQKEHILITVMSNVAYGGANGTAYVTYVFQVLKLDLFYGEKALADSAGFQIMLSLSTQLLGYGVAGLARRFLVYPAIMIWPKSLAQIALNKALHSDDGRYEVRGWKISRYNFFLVTFFGMFLYFWFPDYIFQALSYFNWMTWIAPNNVKLALITGSICGMGLNPWPTFDWNVLSYLIDPIMTPFFSVANATFGMAFVGLVIVPIVYWTNSFNTAYLPINTNHVFDNTGNLYNVSKILNPDYTLNVAAYEAYSPPFLGAANAILYSAFFAIYLAMISYVLLYHWRELSTAGKSVFTWRNARDDHKDVHNRLMLAYREVPEWWYFALLAICFILACVCCEIYHTGMPIWGIVFAIALCMVLQIPIGMINAVTNLEVTNNVLAEYIGGLAIEDKPIANMIFKSYGYIAAAQSVQFAQDLKLGHYLKVAPVMMFAAQVWATILGAFVSIGVNQWELENIKNICQPDNPNKFTCPGTLIAALLICLIFY